MTLFQPHRFDDQSNRTNECKNALRAAFEELVDDALTAGWDRYEVSLALSELGEQLVQATAESAGSEADIAIAKAIFKKLYTREIQVEKYKRMEALSCNSHDGR